ncbi:outer membrane lipoprotein SlyB [Chitinivorax tropicus]|uniref:Outer membrane lipoprotein SlyB n=1 Tax=Chitinivorax tropicus TaxID=714531 RepID=A0A840MED9_9PROT|nr:glycine zipper 2TM domain-containing protein [Chitinivorax tropicus]MBB5017048.1 outer membrane lipoprotein SlyB [Chitinivorax tropicus]
MKPVLLTALCLCCQLAWADANADFNMAKQKIDADYKAALTACGEQPKAEQAACKREAKSTMQASLSDARKQKEADAKCRDCGTVISANTYEIKGEGSALGAVAGGVAGALLGKQVGKGDGNKVATVAGAAGGAYAGYKLEEHIKTKQAYEYEVKLANGKTVTIRPEPAHEQAQFKAGDKVKVNGQAIQAR